MLKPGADEADTVVVVRYRPPLIWITYLCAALIVLVGIAGVAAATKHALGATQWTALLVVVALMCSVAPAALVMLARGTGVLAADAGVVSVGNRYADVIRWEDVDRFENRENRRNRSVAVYAILADGSEVVLAPLRGRLWTRPRLRRIGAELQMRLLEERAKAQTRSDPPPPFTALPRGWRRRERRIQRGGHAAGSLPIHAR